MRNTTPTVNITPVLTATVFAIVFLVTIIFYGGDLSRCMAVSSSLLACYSQFVAQDYRYSKLSVWLAYGAFIVSLSALLLFWMGY